MYFPNLPEAPSPEYIQDKHMHEQEKLLADIKATQQKQLELLNKMQADSDREAKINRYRFWITLIVSLIAAIAAVISALPYIPL